MKSQHALLERYLGSGLSGRKERQLREHMESCGRCRRSFERFVLFERALTAKGPEDLGLPGPMERERLLARQAWSSPSSGAHRWLAGGLVAAAVALLAMLGLPFLSVDGGGDQPVARGPSTVEAVGIRLFRAGEGGVEEVGLSKTGVRPGVPLQFTYSSSSFRHMRLFAVTRGGPRSYFPGPLSDSTLIEPELVNEPLGRALVLADDHPTGSLPLVAVFSSEPLSEELALLAWAMPSLRRLLGLEVIAKVPTQLHTPLMSGSNAISGIAIIGALLAAGAGDALGGTLGVPAVAAAMINVVGGYLVTDRMLKMFRRRK